ncbi:uncharacterized protein LOC120681897 isoform X2 [Panicum virgatum]|uniref:uncharacterized protein LOC120681897 isoform X2 n=1 Tax=Panicum virgatum TaxID=38727 RepID=UPI0019D53D84|nr:uncharacterized protein LOC120681897 isoform X2 [Panicum virgatum]
MVEPVQVTAPAPAPAASTVVNKQEDLARHPAEKSRVDSAVASPSTIGGDRANPECMKLSVVTVVMERSDLLPGDYTTKYKGTAKFEAREVFYDEDHKFIILIARTNKEYAAVNFRDGLPNRELVFTIGAMAGTKLNSASKTAPIKALIGRLGIYKGEVITPICDAVNLKNGKESWSEMYFELSCDVHDRMVTLTNIDGERRRLTSDTVRSAPVFSLSNEFIGLIYSHGMCHDVKVGLHRKSIITLIKKMCGRDNWKDVLKGAAKVYLEAEAKKTC